MIIPVYINYYIYIYTSLSLPGHERGAGQAAGCQSLRRCSLQAVQDQAGAQGTRKLGDLQRKVSLKWRIPNSWLVYNGKSMIWGYPHSRRLPNHPERSQVSNFG